MALSIGANAAALKAAYYLNQHTKNLERNYREQASGLRINSAADDTGGLALTERLTARINSQRTAQRSLNEGSTMMQIAGDALSRISDLVQQVRDYATQALTADFTNATTIQTQIGMLTAQIDSIVIKTHYNGQTLFSGGPSDLTFMEGGEISDLFQVDLFEFGTHSHSLYAREFIFTSDTDSYRAFTAVTSQGEAHQAITLADKHIARLVSARTMFAGWQARLEASSDMLSARNIQLEAARSSVRDTDYAKTSADLVRNQILQQAATSMLSQTSSNPQVALTLLR